jgi:hypothetical protein
LLSKGPGGFACFLTRAFFKKVIMEIQLTRLENAFTWLQDVFSTSDEFQTQNIQVLMNKLNLLCNCLPFLNNQMAIAKKLLNEKKVTAYHRLKTSGEANQEYYAPSLAKDYVNAQCSAEQYAYDLAERCSRTIVHLINALITCISALKEEIKINAYAN